MEENELRELLQAATALGRASSMSPSVQRGSSAVSLLSSLLPPLQSAAAAPKLAPGKMKTVVRGEGKERPGAAQEGEDSHGDDSSGNDDAVAVMQEVKGNSIKAQTVAISQVKRDGAGVPAASATRLIAVTRHCVAYVLGERKIRLIANKDGAKGLMDLGGAQPVVDLVWSTQAAEAGRDGGLLANPSQEMLATLSADGEVCVAIVYAESASMLASEVLGAASFPELRPARGLAWSGPGPAALLAVFGGASEEVFLLQPGAAMRTAVFASGVAAVQTALFAADGRQLVVAGLQRAAVFAVSSLEEISLVRTVALPPDTQRVWLVDHPAAGVLAVAAVCEPEPRLVLLPATPQPAAEQQIVVSIVLPGPPAELFVAFDSLTAVLGIGALSSSRMLCLRLADFPQPPILAAGQWPNAQGALSVVATSQLHRLLAKSASQSAAVAAAADLLLYAYHSDSVKLHRLTIDWDTRLAEEPTELPSPAPLLKPLPRDSCSPAAESPSSGMLHQIQQLLHGDRERRQQELHDAVVPALRESLEAFLLQRMSEIAAKMTLHVDGALSRIQPKCEAAVQKSLPNPDRLAAHIGSAIQEPLKAANDQSVQRAVEKQLIPAVQALLQELVRQLAAQLGQALVEASAQPVKLLAEEMAQLKHTLSDLQRTVTKLPSAEDLLVLAAHKAPPSPKAADPMAHLYAELEAELKKAGGGFISVLRRVLDMGNIETLNWLIEQTRPTDLTDSDEAAPELVLSLAQQLGADLSTLTETKLGWLTEIFTVFVPSAVEDPRFLSTAQKVLDELFGNLRVLFVEVPSSSPLHKQVKTVMRLVCKAMS